MHVRLLSLQFRTLKECARECLMSGHRAYNLPRPEDRMRLAIPKETVAGERRVALVPEQVKRLCGKKFSISVQAGAGVSAHIADAEYAAAGAEVVKSAAALYEAADLVIKVQPPEDEEIAQ